MTKQCVLMKHGLALFNTKTVATCCYNPTDPRDRASYDIDPVYCQTCMIQEQNGQHSYRQGVNQKYGLEHNHSNPIVLDLIPNRNCNLACKICDSNYSSTWAKIKQIKIDQSFNATEVEFQNQFTGRDLSHVREINFSGGEPFLNNNIVRYLSLLSTLIDFGQCELRFSTNGTVRLNTAVMEFLAQFKLVQARFSLDDIEQAHEYHRYPSTWKSWEDNWKYFLENMPHNTMVSINRTVSILNISRLNLLEQWHVQYNKSRVGDPVDLIDHFVREGPYNLSYLTEELKKYVFETQGPDSRAWNYIKNRPTTTNINGLKNTILAQDQLHNQQLSAVDSSLYNILFK